jgi:hypothetical protein
MLMLNLAHVKLDSHKVVVDCSQISVCHVACQNTRGINDVHDHHGEMLNLRLSYLL